ncbi:MAG: hypothetical protein H7Y38_15300 [Armatimonadetes bacterium]|nr:hypothetical protein [Armatimonadota bacterium]
MASQIPDVPTFSPAKDSEKESPAFVANTDTARETQFVPQTLRVFGIVVALFAVGLAGTGRIALILPFVGGAALGAVLLAGFEFVVRRVFTPDAVLASRRGDAENAPKKFNGKAAILLFALIKYPAVAVLIYFVIRTGDTAKIIAFASGFVLLQLIVGLRGLGAFLIPRANK